ncbi:MAG: matrixin family metalloprotease [Halobacteria archaeon]
MALAKTFGLILFLTVGLVAGVVAVEPESTPPVVRGQYEVVDRHVDSFSRKVVGERFGLNGDKPDQGTVEQGPESTSGSSQNSGGDGVREADGSNGGDTNKGGNVGGGAAEDGAVGDGTVGNSSTGDTGNANAEISAREVGGGNGDAGVGVRPVGLRPGDIHPNKNPWQQRKVTVGIDRSTDIGRNYSSHVRKAVNYWMNNMNKADYRIYFDVDPDATNPDVMVVVKESIEKCNRNPVSGIIAGCTKLIENKPNLKIPTPVELKVDWRLSDEVLLTTLKHEFGHILGLEHDDEPAELMRHNATGYNRFDLPWNQNRTYLYVDNVDEIRNNRDFYRQIEHVAEYFTTELNKNVSVTRFPSEADVYVSVPSDMNCSEGNHRVSKRSGHASCTSAIGDYDDDGERDVKIKLNQTYGEQPKVKAAGWHVGYWLARLYGYPRHEVPEVFDPESPGNERVEWWK